MLFIFPELTVAQAESSSTSGIEHTLGKIVWLLVLGVASAKSFALRRQETTSNVCVTSLGITTIGLMLLVATSILRPYVGQFYVLVSGLGLFVILVGLILGFVGIAQYKGNGEFKQGRKQAAGSILIGLLVIGVSSYYFYVGYMIGIGAVNKADTAFGTPAAPLDFHSDELNFHFTSPAGKYVEFKARATNADAIFGLRSRSGGAYFIIIAEVTNSDVLTTEGLAEIVRTNLRAATDTTPSFAEPIPYEINGVEGIKFEVDATVNNLDLTYIYWVLERNGYLYQLMSWSGRSNKAQLRDKIDPLLQGFSLLEPDRVVALGDEKPLDSVHSSFGYDIDLQGSRWLEWPDFKVSTVHADSAGLLGEHARFQVIPFCYQDQAPHEDAIISALLSTHNIDYPGVNLVRHGPISLGVLDGQLLKYSAKSDDDLTETRAAIVFGETCAFLNIVWSTLGKRSTDQLAQDLFARIQYQASASLPESEQHPINQAILHNRAGLYYHSAENYPDALEQFKYARQLDRENLTYFHNALDAIGKLEQHQLGVDYFNDASESLAGDPESLSWNAWYLSRLGENEGAAVAYRDAFTRGYRNDFELGVYIDLLMYFERYAEAKEVREQFALEKNSFSMLRKLALIHSAQEEFDEALALLDSAEKMQAGNIDIVFDRIDIYRSKGEFRIITRLCEDLIATGHGTAGAYYQKGRAEYNLSWYIQAKDSFEKALIRSPGNESIKDYLQQIQGFLGQGDSSLIAGHIDAVELPASAAIANALEEADIEEYDSYYLHRSTSYYFSKGEKLRKTLRRTIKVLNASGIDRFSTITAQYDPFIESAFVNSVEVFDNEGNLVSRGLRKDYYVTDTQSEMADTDKTIHIPVSNLLPGYTVSYSITTESLYPAQTFSFKTLYLSASRPVAESFVYISGDIDALEYQQTATARPRKSDDSLLWLHHNPRPYSWEPMEVDYSEYIPSVSINHVGQQWSLIGNDYVESIEDKLVLDDETRKLAIDLVSAVQSTDEKLVVLTRFVQDKITYKALEFGVRGRIPNSAKHTIANSYGDCKDHAVLLHNLFKSVGIDSNLVLVSLSQPVKPELPSLNQFDHMVVYVPGVNGGLFIDGTDKDMSLVGLTPNSLAGVVGLRLATGESSLIKFPKYTAVNTGLQIRRHIEFAETGEARVVEALIFSDYWGSLMRSHLKTIEKNKQIDWGQQFISDINDEIVLQSLSIEKLYDVASDLVLNLVYTIPADIVNNERWEFEDPSVWERYYIMPKTVHQRKTDFQVKLPLQLTSEVEISFPRNFNARINMDSEFNFAGEYGEYSVKLALDGQKLTKKFHMSTPSNRFRSSQYAEFVKFHRGAISALKRPITLSRLQ